jgi:hypothetical protein
MCGWTDDAGAGPDVQLLPYRGHGRHVNSGGSAKLKAQGHSLMQRGVP